MNRIKYQMPEVKKKPDSPWWLYSINGLVLLWVGFYFLIDHDYFIEMGPVENNPQGRKGQGLLLLIDAVGGRWLVIPLMIMVAAFCLYRGYQGYKSKK